MSKKGALDNKAFMANFDAFKKQWETENADAISQASTMITENPTPKRPATAKQPKPEE